MHSNMQTELSVISAKLDAIVRTLHHGEYANYDIRREFLLLQAYLSGSSHTITDVEATCKYATDVMEKCVHDFHNVKHPRFIQADALRRMAEAILSTAEDPTEADRDEDKARVTALRYAQEAYDQVVGLYLK